MRILNHIVTKTKRVHAVNVVIGMLATTVRSLFAVRPRNQLVRVCKVIFCGCTVFRSEGLSDSTVASRQDSI